MYQLNALTLHDITVFTLTLQGFDNSVCLTQTTFFGRCPWSKLKENTMFRKLALFCLKTEADEISETSCFF